jgi:hypothetical protein
VENPPITMVIYRKWKLTHPLRTKSHETVRHRKRSSLRLGDKPCGSLNAFGAHYLEGRQQRLKKFLSNIAAVMKFGLSVDTYRTKTNPSR